MAGIGFPLLKLYERNTLASSIQVVGYAMFIAAGPSLMTILCFVLVAVFTGGLATEAVVAFRVAVVYAFAVAFIVAAPISLVAARLVSNAFSRGDFTTVRGIFSVGVGLAAISGIACSALLFLNVSDGDVPFVVASTALAGLVCGLLVATSFATALREFKAVSFAFAAGAALSCTLVTTAINWGADEEALILAFHAGLVVAFFGVTRPLFASFPEGSRALWSYTREFFDGLARHKVLALGGFTGALGLWADKFILWQSGTATINGLTHQPSYDSSVFIAYLLILPGLSVFLVLSETELFSGIRRYQRTIDDRSTLRQINAELNDVGDRIAQLVFRLTLVQIFVAMIMILAAPLAIELLRLDQAQLPVLRFLIMASAFQFAFLACSAVILFIGDVRSYCLLQLTFLAANTFLTISVYVLTPDLVGLAYLVACAGVAALAYSMQLRSVGNLNADILARA